MSRCKPIVMKAVRNGPPTLPSDRRTEMWLELLRRAEPDVETGPEYLSEPECILLALAQAVEQRDSLTAGHCERMALISVSIGIALRLSRVELLALYRGGFLHDIGKVGMPDSILFKPGRLTPEEWVTMRSHATRGEEICRPMKSLAPVLPIIRHHHERWDGSGYPDGLARQDIPLLARVLQMADIYDALTSARPYKKPYPPAAAMRVIEAETENGWRDPELTDLFLRMHPDVIAKLADYNAEADSNLRKMRMSMRNLQRFLDAERQVVA
jgi:response regulator RpfG family c-di-GMP phosphodiesterase